MKSFQTSLFIISILACQLIFSIRSSAQCVHSIYPSSASIPGLGGSDYIYLTTEECEYYEAYTNDEWFYVWVDYYEEIITVYADPNNQVYRQGTLIIDNYNSESDFEVPVSQEYGCEQLPSPGTIYGPSLVCAGGSGNFWVHHVEGATLYNWEINGVNVPWNSDTAATINFNIYTSPVTLSVSAYNDCGEGVLSQREITLSFGSNPGTVSSSQNIPVNTAPNTLINVTSASGIVGQHHYQWQWSPSGTGSWSDIQGATGNNYSPGRLTSLSYYRRASDDDCPTSFSNVLTINTSSAVDYLTSEEIQDPSGRQVDTTLLVGSTAGSAGINSLGGFAYSIPINLPAGVNGLTPGISLEYSSNRGTGIAGYGWQVNGISTINRGPQTIYNDGRVTEVMGSTLDRFYLDGQRLVTSGSSYWDPNNQYYTENDIFTRIKPQEATSTNIPWFRAETRAGLIYEYGHGNNSDQTISGFTSPLNWYVSKIEDLYGNQILYYYLKDHNMIYPLRISYGPYEVSFSYSVRNDKTTSFFKGSKIEQWYILDKIDIDYNSVPIHSYNFKYSFPQSPYDSYSVLREITELGIGGESLNSTIFSYKLPEYQTYPYSDEHFSHQYISYTSRLCTGDFNGDGKTDFLCIPDASKGAQWSGLKVFFGNGNEEFPTYFSSTNSIDLSALKDIRTLDINGDGLDDVIYESGSWLTSTFYYMLCDGTSFSSPQAFLTQDSDPDCGLSGKILRNDDMEDDAENNIYRNENYGVFPERTRPAVKDYVNADYNGDGVNDIFINSDNGYWTVYSFINSSGGMMASIDTLISENEVYLPGMILSADFNGDGRADIWNIKPTAVDIYTLDGNVFSLLLNNSNSFGSSDLFILGDYNGDGKTDVFVYDDSACKILLSKGNSFETHYISYMPSDITSSYIRTGDFNGDGMTDLLVSPPDENSDYLFFSVEGGTNFAVGYLDANLDNSTHFFLSDFNGDGFTEIINTSDDSSWSGYYSYTTNDQSGMLLNEISNGYGRYTRIKYAKMLDEAREIYTKGSGSEYPVMDFEGKWDLVNSIQVENDGSLDHFNYQYEGARMHLRGKGFLGFSSVTVTDSTRNITTTTLSDHDASYYYPRVIESFKYLAGSTDTVSKIKNTWANIVLDSQQKRIFPYIESSHQYNLLNEDTISMNAEFDNYGNPVSLIKNYSGGPEEAISNTYDNSVSSTKWLLGRAVSTTVEFTDNDTTIIRRTGRVFHADNNILLRDTLYPGTANQLVHAYTYNTNGTLSAQSASAGEVSRSASLTYETDNVRLHSATDQLSHVTTNTYNNYGLLESIEDYLGKTIDFEYDALGRSTHVVHESGEEATSAYKWEGPTEELAAMYSITNTTNSGTWTKSWFDKAGREIRTDKKGFDGTVISVDTRYNIKGAADSISEPFFPSGTPTWNRITYDNYGRKTNLYRPSGRNSAWSYYENTITETTAGKTFSRTIASNGTLAEATDAGGTISYQYYPDGSLKTVTAPGNIITTVNYDAAGNRSQITDPSSGGTTNEYNGFGEVVSQTNAKNETTSIIYNSDGTVHEKTTPEGTTTYSYNTLKQLTEIASPGSVNRTVTYDDYGRVSAITDHISGTSSFTTSYTYDNTGRISTITHPSGITETRNYTNGYLSSVSAGGVSRWTTLSMNERQQVTSGRYGSNLNTTIGFDSYGYLSSMATGSIQDYSYNFDAVTGNLLWRQNNKYQGLKETFYYDDLERLDSVFKGVNNPVKTLDMQYDSNTGSITGKSDAGTFLYENSQKPYTLTGVDPSTGLVPEADQLLTYTSFGGVHTISEDGDSAVFAYNSDGERIKMILLHNGSHLVTRWYSSSTFMKDSVSGTARSFTYIGGDAYSAPVVALKQGSSVTYYYLLRDHLGSITHVVSSTDNSVTAEYSYDSWGRMRNPQTWENYTPGSEPVLFSGRGFTGHEHLPWFNLINMNGRVYDPLTGGFLSPDPYIQSAELTQNYNRYTYCFNNPLKYTDPKGTTVYVVNQSDYQSFINAVCSGASLNDDEAKQYYAYGLRFSDASWLDIYANQNGEPGSNGGYLFSNENAGYTYLWFLSGEGNKVETMAWLTNSGLFVLPIEGYTYDKSRKLTNQHNNAEWEYYEYINFNNEWYMLDPNANKTYRLIANIHVHSWNKDMNSQPPDQGFSLYEGINDDEDFLRYFHGIPMSVVDYDGRFHSMIYDSRQNIPFRVISELDLKFDIFDLMQTGNPLSPIYLKYLIQK